MASPALLTPTSKPQPLAAIKPKPTIATAATSPTPSTPPQQHHHLRRRHFLSLSLLISSTPSWLVPIAPSWLVPIAPAFAASDEEYVKESEDVIIKVRSTINMDKNDPNLTAAVAELRETSNSWVAKYRREKALLGRASFRDIYSALNAVSGHYISFGPTAPIPAKRKARILEEVDTAEKALQRGR